MNAIVKDEIRIQIVARHFRMPVSTMRGVGRGAVASYARHVAMYVLHESGLSYPKIADRLGRRDHTTAISAVRKIERLLADRDVETVKHLAAIHATLNGHAPSDRRRVAGMWRAVTPAEALVQLARADRDCREAKAALSLVPRDAAPSAEILTWIEQSRAIFYERLEVALALGETLRDMRPIARARQGEAHDIRGSEEADVEGVESAAARHGAARVV